MINHIRKFFDGSDCKHLLDIYCGAGLFSICFARQFASVIGIECKLAFS
jgi:tRNA/tmRNA/rRNA uracil-C5-methylase (TrmA/RlmC/RlmD family)